MDASALVAIIVGEPAADLLEGKLDTDQIRMTSGLAIWEAGRALGKATGDIVAGHFEVQRFCDAFGIRIVTIGQVEAQQAARAHAQYGKGTRHPARLNMGDCFAYACAMTNGAKLLNKGNAFIHTDLA